MAERLVFTYGNASAGRVPGRDRQASAGQPPLPQAPAAATARRAEQAGAGADGRAFAGLMLFTALLYFRPQDHLSFLIPLHLAEVSAIFALVMMAAARLQRGQTFTRVTPELLGVLAFGGLMLALAPFSIWMGGSVATFTNVYVKVILIFVLMVNTLSTPRRLEQFAWLLVVATGYIAFRAVFDYARGLNLIENGRVQGAVGGMFRNPNDLALNMVAVMPLAILFTLRSQRVAARLAAAGCAALMLATIVASHSRSGTVGLAAMLAVLGVHLVRRRPALVFAGAMALMLAVPMAPDSYWHRLASITDASQDDTGSREARSVLLREGYAAFVANPWTGVGAGQFKNYAPDRREEAWRETHNVLLQVGAELGVAGLLVFLFLVARAALARFQVRALLKRATGGRGRGRRGRTPPAAAPAVTEAEAASIDDLSGAVAAALAGWFVCAMFASVAYYWTFYYLLALAAAPRELLAERLPAARRRTVPALALAPAAQGHHG